MLKKQIALFQKYHYLLEDLVARDIKVKYRRSVLGILWSVLNPLLMMLVITAVFQNLFRFDIENFPVYYLTGWLIFNFVTEATTMAMTSIIDSAPLIKKVYIPKYMFPLEKCLFAFVNMLFSLVAVLIMLLLLGVKITWTLLLAPLPLLLALVFSVGFGLILTSLNVFFRDTTHLYGVWTVAWMYLTPIIYPVSILNEFMQSALRFNPLYYYVEYFRQVTMYGTVPSLETLFFCALFSIGFFLAGLVIFKRCQDRFILFI